MIEMSERSDGAWRMGFAGDTLNTAWYAPAFLPDGWSAEYLTALGVSGITLAILAEDRRHDLIASLARARDRGALVAFDPNIRPALWPDTDLLNRLETIPGVGFVTASALASIVPVSRG